MAEAHNDMLRRLWRRHKLRKVKRVVPGWPQAGVQLACRHWLVVPTWKDGRTSPPLPARLWCHRCGDAWYKRHGHRFINEGGANAN